MKKIAIFNFYLKTWKISFYSTFNELEDMLRELYITITEADNVALNQKNKLITQDYLILQEVMLNEEVNKLIEWEFDNREMDVKN